MILNEEVILIFMHPTNMTKLHDLRAARFYPGSSLESAWKVRETEAETPCRASPPEGDRPALPETCVGITIRPVTMLAAPP